MANLAQGTGGTFFYQNNDLSAGFERLTQLPESIYLLEIPLDGVKPNGLYHRLKVEVDRVGVTVQSRLGYLAPNKKKK